MMPGRGTEVAEGGLVLGPRRSPEKESRAFGRSLRIVVLSGLLAGTLDICFAFIFYGSHGAHPAMILSGIASGVLGRGAYEIGAWSAALGAVLHFTISVAAAFVYWFVSRRVSFLLRRPFLSGAGFGVAMYLVMHFVVIPLSRFPFHLPSLRNLVGELFSHIVLFGMVIAAGVARATSKISEDEELDSP